VSAASPVELLAALCLGGALVQGLAAGRIHALALRWPRYARLFHLLGEVELVFAFWALLLLVGWALSGEPHAAWAYARSQHYTEPLFVFAVMIVVGTRPLLDAIGRAVGAAGRLVSGRGAIGLYFATLALLPLLGSLITEVAAMTVAALVLRDRLFSAPLSLPLRYATLGVLFVNVSIGGVLTHFAAPPVLMVAARWGWGSADMFGRFGIRATVAVVINALLATWWFRRELAGIRIAEQAEPEPSPLGLTVAHLGFLVAIVATGQRPVLFLALLLLFLVFARITARHQDALIWRESAFVGLFLAGLVVLGGMQRWWLQPVLQGLDESRVFYGAAALTAVTDNAALTYLGSLVEGLSPAFKVSLLAGAVVGGGLTVIANAPNPAGAAILREGFPGARVSPLWLLLAALPATGVAVLAFRLG
jgi:hypothetical protein